MLKEWGWQATVSLVRIKTSDGRLGTLGKRVLRLFNIFLLLWIHFSAVTGNRKKSGKTITTRHIGSFFLFQKVSKLNLILLKYKYDQFSIGV